MCLVQWHLFKLKSFTLSYSRATALAILSGSEGSKALQMPTHIRLSHSGESKQNLAPVQKFLQRKLKLNQLFTKKEKDPTPLQLLVKEMPGKTFLDQYQRSVLVQVKNTSLEKVSWL